MTPKLTSHDARELAALFLVMDKSKQGSQFDLSEQHKFLANPAVAITLLDVLLKNASPLRANQMENRFIVFQRCLQLCLPVADGNPELHSQIQSAIEQAIRQHLKKTVDFPQLRALISICIRNEIFIAPPLLDEINHLEYPEAEEFEHSDLDEMAENFAQIVKDFPEPHLYQLAEFLFEQFGQLPSEIAPVIAAILLRADDLKLRNCATLFLLHPNPAFRKALANELPTMAEQKLLQSIDWQRLIWIRNWLPKNLHAKIDQSIKLLQRQQLTQPTEALAKTSALASIEKIQATAFDNSGAMMLVVELKHHGKFYMFSCILAQKIGIQDAFFTEQLSKKRLNAMSSTSEFEMPVVTLDTAMLRALLAHFSVINQQQQRCPLALLLFKEFTGDSWEMPQQLQLTAVSAAAKRINKRKTQLDVAEFLAGWSDPSQQSDMAIADYISQQMEPERLMWRERFLLTAFIFGDAGSGMADLLEAAAAIDAGTPLLELGEIRAIAMHSLGQFFRPSNLLEQLLQVDEFAATPQDIDMLEDWDDLDDIFEAPVFDSSNRPKRALYQIKIQLKGSKPLISRTLQLMNTTRLDDFHQILQIVMGFDDGHAYEFNNITHSFYPDWFEGNFDGYQAQTGQLRDLLQNSGDKCNYIYDFGDYWLHNISLEKILPAGRSNVPPQLLKAKGAGPYEDCGGIAMYNYIRAVLSDPAHKDHKRLCREWELKSGSFDGDFVDIEQINQWLQPN